MKFLRGALALAAVLALTALAPSAHATLELKLSDGTTSFDILDEGANDSCSGQVGCITFLSALSGPIGKFTINVTTGTGTSPASSSALDELDLNSVDIKTSSGAPTTLTIELSDNNYTPGQGGWNFGIGGTLCSGCTLVAEAFGGKSNTKFDYSNPLGSFVFTTSAYSGSTSTLVGTPADPFALTIRTILTVPGLGTTSYDAKLDPAPEPSSVALLGGILLVTAGALRRKLRRS